MFDTNIFNAILDESISLQEIKGKEIFYITHVQMDEINQTKDQKRKVELLKTLTECDTRDISTSSFVLGVSRLGRARLGGDIIPKDSDIPDTLTGEKRQWGSDINLYDPIREKLNRLNKNKKNNVQDAIIAETAIKNGFTLITHDKDLFSVTTFYSGACANIYQVLSTR